MFSSMRIFILIGILLLAACGEASREGLRFGLSSRPVTLDPRYATDAASTRINRLLYRRLVDFDDGFKAIPSLATWQRLTPIHYRFSLGSEGRIFHDGSPLGASDVKATYDSLLAPKTASPHRASLEHIEHIEVLDEDTVDFHLRHADVLFPGRLVVGILPAAAMASGHPFHSRPLGSGAFRFLAWPEEGVLRLHRLADGQMLEFVHVPEPTVRALKLLRGEIDMLQGDLPAELVVWLAERPELDLQRGRGSGFAYLGFNLKDSLTGQLPVRSAIAHALDRPAIIRYLLRGAARPASALLPPDHWAGHPNLPTLAHDPERARRLLKSAGFDATHPPRITYKTSSDSFRIRLATVIQHQLAAVGIDVRLQSYDWGTFYGDIKGGRFQMYSLAWIGIQMPDIFRYAFHSGAMPPDGANRGRLKNARVDQLIEAAEASQSLEQQAGYYRELQYLLLQQLPYVPLWYEDNVYVARREIQGYRLARDGNYDGLKQVVRR